MFLLFLLALLAALASATLTDDLTAMLSLTDGMGNKDVTWTNATAICSWSGLTCCQKSWNGGCADGSVDGVRIVEWYSRKLNGTANLASLPSQLQVLRLENNQLNGTLNLAFLPASMQQLWLNDNQFTGEPNLAAIPKNSSIYKLCLNENQFTGTPNLTSVPSSVKELYLNNNQFTGTPNLASLPPSMEKLWLQNNQFTTGTPILTSLPASMKQLRVTVNGADQVFSAPFPTPTPVTVSPDATTIAVPNGTVPPVSSYPFYVGYTGIAIVVFVISVCGAYAVYNRVGDKDDSVQHSAHSAPKGFDMNTVLVDGTL